jgi:hypothetical protein
MHSALVGDMLTLPPSALFFRFDDNAVPYAMGISFPPHSRAVENESALLVARRFLGLHYLLTSLW